MGTKVIRIWHGCTVVQLITVQPDGGSATEPRVGGAHNSNKVDIEMDPWAGLLVDHSTSSAPVNWRTAERDMEQAYAAGAADAQS